mmetsp:Transcript_58825/g.154941  ORF Transcript_58825/g.154941 Transcript_58825/m.154941 type:complete len:516 (+) Transcript_58825:61-1608(+)
MVLRRKLAFFASAALLASSQSVSNEELLATLDLDDECDARDKDGQCTLNALQLRQNALNDLKGEAAYAHLSGLQETYRKAEEQYKGELNATTDLRARGAPMYATSYSGMAWPETTVSGPGPTHIFAIGDWGGLDGTLWTNMWPPAGRNRLIVYKGGQKAGPSVFPRTRYNLNHSVLLCSHQQFIDCYNFENCVPGCGFVDGVDTQPQLLVAEQFKKYAALLDPKYILNVGDNFYWGGVEKDCGYPMSSMSYEAKHQFDQVYEGVYGGPGLDNVPWFSVLGNHDWGGRVFNNGWDQQIAYTWQSNRWVMPAPYYSTKINYPDQGFSVDLFMLDSNIQDAHPPDEDPEHNICGNAHNKAWTTCAVAGGPPSVGLCHSWFEQMWQRQKLWLEDKLRQSTAEWQIVVTHFPCGHAAEWYRQLKGQGLDLLVTGHRHNQELWDKRHPRSNELANLPCFVTGGGGGISSEATPIINDGNWYGEGQYGFYDLEITKETIVITSIGFNGTIMKNATISPSPKR